MKTTQQKYNEAVKKAEELKLKLEQEKNKTDFIEIDGWAYETKEHDFNKTLDEIKIPEGKELWTAEDCIRLSNNAIDCFKLGLKDCWFFIKQPFEFNENNGYVARFNAGSGRAGLYCDRIRSGSDAELGVRFKWKVKK